ncbi:MAG: OmpH family outer membrane protein [Planctomycetota bacterium]
MKSPVVIVALIGALTLGLYVTAGGQAGSPAAPTKVAVVNMQLVINQSDQQVANRAANQAKAAAIQAEGEQRQQEIASLQVGLDPLVPNSDGWNQQRDKLQQKTLELQVWVQMQEQNNQREQTSQVAEIYLAANEAAKAIAQEAGYDIVLKGGGLPDVTRMNLQQLSTIAQTREVLYASDAVDITDAVMQRLNAEYAQR